MMRLPGPGEAIIMLFTMIGFLTVLGVGLSALASLVQAALAAEAYATIASGLPWLVAGVALGALGGAWWMVEEEPGDGGDSE